MKLTNDNYFSKESNLEYCSATQLKDFMKCEVEALAKVKGELVEEKSKALLFGGYVDAYFSNELDKFKEENPQIFKKDGTLLKDFENANEVIKAIEEDKMLMDYLNGEKQVIMTGTIGGVKFKIKVDALHEDMIIDQKIMSSINEKIWIEQNGYNVKTDFVEAFGYAIQGAIYQSVVEQNTGKKLPFILAVTTKEENPDKALIEIDQEYLDNALAFVTEYATRIDMIKKGLVEPKGCGCCPSCRKGKMVTGVVSYKKLFDKKEPVKYE